LRTKSARTENRPEKERIIRAVEAAREEAGLSQRELSRRLGLHEMTIMRFANGERMLDILEFVDIARALGRKPGEFLDSIVD
jgi:transcriptional regulator with XRE-family HTH domain